MTYSVEQAREALQFIDPGAARADWVRVMASAKAAGLAFDDVCAWSETAANFKSERDVADAWRSIDAEGPIGPGSLFRLARQGGWQPTQSERRPPPARASTQPRREPPKPAIRAGMGAQKVWDAAEPATAAHGYIVRKAGRTDGLRVCRSDLRIGGHDMRGSLLVPVLTLAGELVSLQCIPAEGPKMNLPGHPMRGVFIVGEMVPDGLAYVVEGIGQAWACWKATGRASVVCFGWGRVAAVTAELKAAYPAASLVLVPDAGKETDAGRIAKAQRVQWVAMPEDSPRNFDANDYAAQHGHDALASLLEPQQGTQDAWPLSVSFGDDLGEFTPPDELVQGLLTTHGASMVYGDSNSGKTFCVVDLCCAVARGVDWMGRRTEPGLVVYLAAESPESVRSRLQAYCLHHGVKVPGLAIVHDALDLFSSDADAEAVIALVKAVEAHKGKKVRLIVGDTMARLSAGANENAGQDMGLVVKRIDQIRNQCAAHFLAIHHSGKAQAAGARGWSGIRAAVDTEIEVTDSPQGRCAEVTKQRDLPTKGERIGFRLEPVTLGATKWGTPATSCVVVPTDAPVKQTKGKRMGPVEGAVLEFLRARMVGISRSGVVKHFAQQYPRTSIYRAIDALGDSGMVNIAQESRMVCIADAAK